MDIPKLDITVTKTMINGEVVDVISREEYFKNPEIYSNSAYAMRATADKNIILPIKGEYSDYSILPGIYSLGNIGTFTILPNEDEKENYSSNNCIDMSNTDNIKDLILKGDAVRKLDEPFITSPDNITNIPIRENDQPEMKGLKMALNAKNIDIDKYAGRFGINFPNDKRQLKNNNATLKIIKRFCENCDMEAILTFRDKSDDVPNPMNKEISVSLTELVSDEDYNIPYDIDDEEDEDMEE